MSAPTNSGAPSSGEIDAGAALARNLDGIGDDLRALGLLAERACALVAADRLVARRRLRITVAASASTAALLAILAATALRLGGAAVLVTGLLAAIGASAPGLLLLVRPVLLDQAIAIIDRHRR